MIEKINRTDALDMAQTLNKSCIWLSRVQVNITYSLILPTPILSSTLPLFHDQIYKKSKQQNLCFFILRFAVQLKNSLQVWRNRDQDISVTLKTLSSRPSQLCCSSIFRKNRTAQFNINLNFKFFLIKF